MKRHIVLVFFLLVSFTSGAIDYPSKPDPPRLVNDYTNTLSGDEQVRLENKLVAFNDTTSTQIAIVILNTLDGYPISQYSFELGRRWGIGQEGSNNGALILVAMKDRDVFIATGYGLEGAIPDALAKRIVENQVVPNFKNRNYYRGLDQATDVMIKLSTGEYTAEQVDSGKKTATFLGVLVIIVIFFLLIMFIRVYSVRRYANLNNIGFWEAWALLSQVDKQKGKYRGFRQHGSHWGGSGSSGGGFGGFGGGSFGGGGAGGSW